MSTESRRRYRDRVDCCFSLGRILLLSLTQACNQRCIHCFRNALPEHADAVDLTMLRPALERAVLSLSPDRVVISGGEPTLVPNLAEVIAEIARLGVRPSLCTNATRVDSARARELVDAGLLTATVGMEGTAEDYSWFRGTISGYRLALSGIAALVEHGIGVTVNITLHDRIIGDALGIAGALRGLGLRAISVTSPIAQGRLVRHMDAFSRLDHDGVERFANLLAAASDCPVSLRVPRCDSSTCPSGRSVFAMDLDGHVSRCPDEGSVNVCDAHRVGVLTAAE
jgi:MoaA/NifB/PqqE/SkfB family radical SAM enzyme